jgi:hypothetical protein
VGDCSFVSDFRILELQSFDVIVGMDWLSYYSPMQIHWEQKWLALPYQGEITVLQGMTSHHPASLYLQVCQLSDSTSVEAPPTPLPPKISDLVTQFRHLFEPPTALPRLGLATIQFLSFLVLARCSFVHIAIHQA